MDAPSSVVAAAPVIGAVGAGTAAGTIAVVEAGSRLGATTMDYVVVGSVLFTIVTAVSLVIKGYDWAQNKVRAVVKAELLLHNAEDERRHDALTAEMRRLGEILGHRPCLVEEQHIVGCPTPVPDRED